MDYIDEFTPQNSNDDYYTEPFFKYLAEFREKYYREPEKGLSHPVGLEPYKKLDSVGQTIIRSAGKKLKKALTYKVNKGFNANMIELAVLKAYELPWPTKKQKDKIVLVNLNVNPQERRVFYEHMSSYLYATALECLQKAELEHYENKVGKHTTRLSDMIDEKTQESLNSWKTNV